MREASGKVWNIPDEGKFFWARVETMIVVKCSVRKRHETLAVKREVKLFWPCSLILETLRDPKKAKIPVKSGFQRRSDKTCQKPLKLRVWELAIEWMFISVMRKTMLCWNVCILFQAKHRLISGPIMLHNKSEPECKRVVTLQKRFLWIWFLVLIRLQGSPDKFFWKLFQHNLILLVEAKFKQLNNTKT